MSLVTFAESELNSILKNCKDSESLKMQKTINDDILEVVKIFSNQGHSGYSAKYSLAQLRRLLNWLPLSPLTGEDSEWNKVDYNEDIVYQNKRCPSIFKNKEGRCYNTEGKVFSRDNGHTWYINRESNVPVEFPYYVPNEPERVYIDNNIERKAVLEVILEDIKFLGGNVSELQGSEAEDTLLITLLKLEKFEELEKKLLDQYKITRPLYSFSKDEYSEEIALWSIINIIIESDKDEN